jgi:hypothetical protein
MAKIFNFERHKLCMELKTLKEFLDSRYNMSGEYNIFSQIWFDHSACVSAQKRIGEIVVRLKEIDDLQSSEK